MDMTHRCTTVDPARRVITVKYPDHLPSEPHFLTYHWCECGQEVRVEAVTVESYLERGYHVLRQLQEVNYHASQALANYLGQNYQYPPPGNPAYEDVDPENDEDVTIGHYHRDQMNQDYHHRAEWLSHNNPNRRANLLGPVLDNLLVDREYDSEDDQDDEDAMDYQRDQMNYDGHLRAHRSPYNDEPRRPNLLGPVIQNWLVNPEYDSEVEPIENQAEYNRTAVSREYWPNDYSNDDDDSDEPER